MKALGVQLLQSGQLCVDPPGREIEHERPHSVFEENRPLALMVLIKGLYAFGGAGLGWLPLAGGILVAIRDPSPPGRLSDLQVGQPGGNHHGAHAQPDQHHMRGQAGPFQQANAMWPQIEPFRIRA